MGAASLVYDYFEDHPGACRRIARERPLALGLVGCLAGGASLFAAQALAGRLLILPFSGTGLALALLWQAVLAFLGTALVHQVLDFSGGRGSSSALFVHWGLSELAWTAALPAVLAAQAAFPGSPRAARLALLLCAAWPALLKARGASAEYGVGLGRAWLALGSPFLAAGAASAAALVLAAAGVVSALLEAAAR